MIRKWKTRYLGFVRKYHFNRSAMCKTRHKLALRVNILLIRKWHRIYAPLHDKCTIMRQIHQAIRLVAHPNASNSRSTLMTLIRSTSRHWHHSYALLSARILPRHQSICRRSLLGSWRRKFRNHWRNDKHQKVTFRAQSIIYEDADIRNTTHIRNTSHSTEVFSFYSDESQYKCMIFVWVENTKYYRTIKYIYINIVP